jgi:hypothetical protein
MKKYIVLFSSVMVLSVCAAINVHADYENQASAATAAAPTVTQATYNGITSDPLFTTLLSKNNIKNNLTLKENQICKDIINQENSNKEKAAAIVAKSLSYYTAYNKIINDIKLLLDPIKQKDILYYKALTQSSGSLNTSGQEENLYEKQISSLNAAIKAMRESMKYISLDSVAYQQKSEAIQKNIDQINLSIENLDKEIVQQKANKDKEWNNFSAAMIKGDLKTANECFDNMLKIKEQIIQNYSLILKYKKDIETQLMSIDTSM